MGVLLVFIGYLVVQQICFYILTHQLLHQEEYLISYGSYNSCFLSDGIFTNNDYEVGYTCFSDKICAAPTCPINVEISKHHLVIITQYFSRSKVWTRTTKRVQKEAKKVKCRLLTRDGLIPSFHIYFGFDIDTKLYQKYNILLIFWYIPYWII